MRRLAQRVLVSKPNASGPERFMRWGAPPRKLPAAAPAAMKELPGLHCAGMFSQIYVGVAGSGSGSRIISGLAVAYDEPADYGLGFKEVFERGSFAISIQERDDARCLFNAAPSYVLGRTKPGTLSLSDSGKGLAFTVDAPK